mgnify:CR=1 FL=1
MSANTSIEWTDRTWNPVTGCRKVSPGCKHCYAEGVAHRFWATQYRPVLRATGRSIDTISMSLHGEYLKNGLAGPRRFTDVMTHEDRLLEPLSWRRPSKVFVNSMSDLFHEDVPDEFIDQVFAVMARAKQHTFQILTKRAGRMREYMTHPDTPWRIACEAERLNWSEDAADDVDMSDVSLEGWPLPNVWLGVSVEDQQRADDRIPLLLQTPAAVRFISAEPLLERIDLETVPIPAPGAVVYGLRGVAQPLAEKDTEPDDWKYWTRHSAKLDWVIVGGESGPGARCFDVAWARAIVRQCQAAGVPVFLKQFGARWYDLDRRQSPRGAVSVPVEARWTFIDGGNRKGSDPEEWPEDLRVREFPR